MDKILVVVIDGAADRKVKILGNKTPLEAARIPYLNRLAIKSSSGIMYTVGKGFAPESDAAVLSLLGYNIKKEYTGRGPLEAYGADIKIGENTLALRSNFACILPDRTVVDRRAGRHISGFEARKLAKEINLIHINGANFMFKPTVGYRGVVVINSNFKLSSSISNADIGYAKKGNASVALDRYSSKLPRVKALANNVASRRSARIVNEIIDKAIARLGSSKINSERVRKGLPAANAILLRDAGVGLPKVKSFKEKYGLNAAFITEMPVERGIARLLKMEEVEIKNTSNLSGRYVEMAKHAKNALDEYDFVYVHIKGPDEFGHNGDAIGKKKSLELTDIFFKTLGKINYTIAVTADHSTPCELKAHSSDPVPLIIYNTRIRQDRMKFNENIDAKGSIGVIKGVELVKKIIDSARL
ncbi:MAG: alkaline phosphatase family protein [Candidatus Micrarchaeia archaeon]